MHVLLVAVALAAAPPTPKLAAPGLDYVQVDAKKGDFFLEYLAQELGQNGFQVVTAKQISAVVGLERQKELLGCADTSSSCLAELAGALGADAILVGSLAQLEGTYAFTLRVVSAKDASVLAQRSGRMKGDTAALDWLSETAKKLADGARPQLVHDAPAETNPDASAALARSDATTAGSVEQSGAPPSRGMRRFAWIPGAVAVGCVAGGAIFEAQALGTYHDLQTGNVPPEQRNARALDGQSQNTRAIALFVAGGVSAAAAAGMYLFGAPAEPEEPRVAAVVTPGGAALTLVGRWP